MENWTHIDSAAISGFGYDPTNRILRVSFRTGTVYDYYGASPAVVRALMHAPSKGAYFAGNIRDKFEFRRVR